MEKPIACLIIVAVLFQVISILLSAASLSGPTKKEILIRLIPLSFLYVAYRWFKSLDWD